MSPDWIAGDWGGTRLRLWAMSADGRVLAARESLDGCNGLAPGAHRAALKRAAADWLADGAPVLLCGVAGSRQGWREAPYLKAPCPPFTAAGAVRATPGVTILPGLSQADPPDVMRGEETQLAGLLRARPGFEGVVCLPGTHSKWARLEGGRVTGFQSFLTGEMFDLLASRSILRHSMAGEEFDVAAFDEAAADAIRRPDQAAGRLFPIRAAGLLQGENPGAARARLSGLLIGAELAAAAAWRKTDAPLIIVGAGRLAGLYVRALAGQGCAAEALPGEDLALRGLIAAWEEMNA